MMVSALDGYTLKARYLPALIVVLPLWLAFSAWFAPDKRLTGVLSSGVVTLVLGGLLGQIGRDAGKRRQESLFKAWGGKPTTLALSYRSRIVNPVTLARCHTALRQLVPGLKLPANAEEEKADWKSAKRSYESAAEFLREATRDKSRFRLIYAENVSYGFRRNLWAMKPGAIAVAVLSLLGVTAHMFTCSVTGAAIQGLDAGCLLLSATLIALWVARFTRSWVKLAADEYAIRLLASAEVLASGKGTDTKEETVRAT